MRNRRAKRTQPEVFCAESGSERSRADMKERLQYLAAGTAGAAPQDAGYGAVIAGAAGYLIHTPPPAALF